MHHFFKKKRIIAAWILALISLLPILFIIWMSILNADDIQQSVFYPQKRNNKVTFFTPQPDSSMEIAASSLGNVYLFQASSNYKEQEIVDINSAATFYSQNENTLWAFSADKGLIEIDLKGKTEKNSYNWDYFQNSYSNFDPSSFSVSRDVLPEHFTWLANNLNNKPALPLGDTTFSMLAGIRFYSSEEIIMQLNSLLRNNRSLNTILKYWERWDGWLNPQIHILFKSDKRSEKENRLLFRFCLSELFPNQISRLKYFSWQDIWVSQVMSSGLSVLAAGDKVIMGIRGEFFPGIAIFDTNTKEIYWITEATGLPSASIHNIVQLSEHDILIEHDFGLSTIQFNSGKIKRNYIFGEGGLPYLDEQSLYIKALSEDKISISYGSGSIVYDLEKFEAKTQVAQTVLSPRISSYFETQSGSRWIGYNDGKLEVLDSSLNIVRTGTIPRGSRKFQWSNYQDIIRIMPLATFIKNSILLSLSISLLCTLLAIFPSYAIARLNFFGKSAFTKILLSSQVLSSLPFVVPIFVIFIVLQMKEFHLFNNFAAILFVNTAFFLPLTVQFMFDMFRAIPPNLEESAMMDGCTPWKTFWKIIMPVILPALATCLIYIFLFAWDEILFIWILSTDSSTATLPVGIRLTVGQLANRPELLMAFSVIASLPPMILFAFAQPFLMKSLIRKVK